LADHHDGASITAVAVATHEVGHAIQHHRGERMLALRGTLARLAMVTDRFATIFFYAAPLLAVFARTNKYGFLETPWEKAHVAGYRSRVGGRPARAQHRE
ncbi:MAG: zinc metallopeptidase, partial [Anaerolineae bacterium]